MEKTDASCSAQLVSPSPSADTPRCRSKQASSPIPRSTAVDQHTGTTKGYQLEQWAYQTSNANITVAEKFEKSNWEAERLERL